MVEQKETKGRKSHRIERGILPFAFARANLIFARENSRKRVELRIKKEPDARSSAGSGMECVGTTTLWLHCSRTMMQDSQSRSPIHREAKARTCPRTPKNEMRPLGLQKSGGIQFHRNSLSPALSELRLD